MARTLGMKEITIFWKIVIPNCIPGIVSGILLAFTRAFGEFGATIMVAGNIPGKNTNYIDGNLFCDAIG